jgi:hypothetical protein
LLKDPWSQGIRYAFVEDAHFEGVGIRGVAKVRYEIAMLRPGKEQELENSMIEANSGKIA